VNLLGRALDNLLSNALRHAPDGSSVCVKVARQDGLASMSVRDRGPGLPMSMRTRLFQRYATDRTDGGNGLGLALVARVARQHQARVQVQTETGQGTTISLLMKCDTAGSGTPGAMAAPVLTS
jgi:signal transduction histidine kinase